MILVGAEWCEEWYKEWDEDPCVTCERDCDGWEMQFCCTLCRHLGLDNCDNCDPMDL